MTNARVIGNLNISLDFQPKTLKHCFTYLVETLLCDLKQNYKSSTPQKSRPSKISCRSRLFLFLLRFRRGLPLEELAFCFQCSVSYVGEICYVMTRHIYLTFKELERDMFISAAEQKKHKPKVMMPFKTLRLIMDGVSIFIEKPSNFQQQGNTFSVYKSHNVLIYIVGISCSGATIFCSSDCEGNMKEKDAVLKSKLLDWLDSGDEVMTDRGFDLTAEFQSKGVHLIKPPVLGDRDSLTPEEELFTESVAAARIYSEHAMAEIKDNRLLQGVMPLSMLPVVGNLVYIAAYLRNFSPTRIKNVTVRAVSSKSDK